MQIGKGSRGDVTILPTLVINNRQYRGMYSRAKSIVSMCAGGVLSLGTIHSLQFILQNLYIFSGKLAKQAVLKALCSGFEETTEPAICLSDG